MNAVSSWLISTPDLRDVEQIAAAVLDGWQPAGRSNALSSHSVGGFHPIGISPLLLTSLLDKDWNA
jgi:hypothetical protein